MATPATTTANWTKTPNPPPVIDIVQTRSEVDHGKRVDSDEVTLFSAHDP